MNSGTYILVGAGGTGSIVAPHLLRHLRKVHGTDFKLWILDGDIVSEKNTSRQDFTRHDIGSFKAEILSDRLDPTHNLVDHLTAYIDDTNARNHIQEGDTVLITVDNYRARADIERRALELNNVTVINAGNEDTTATCQIFVRRNGQNLTPPISYQHPEILAPGMTRREESCMVHVDSPDHEQTIAANLLSAAWLLSALVTVQTAEAIDEQAARMALALGDDPTEVVRGPAWHELYADINKGKAGGVDWRAMGSDAWKTYEPAPQEITA